MTGLPTLTVKLDDGTGTFPDDITKYVAMTPGYSITRGRGDGVSTINPGTCSLTLENDGRFTPGNAPYGFRVNQVIQVTETVGATAIARFTGAIQTITPGWPDGGDAYSTCSVTAADLMTVLQRRVLRSMATQEFLADSAVALYPLSEPSGATAAADLSGNGGPSLKALGSGAAVDFGQTGVAVDGTSAATFANGQYLSAIAPPAAVAVEVTFQTADAASSGQQLVAMDNGTSTSWQLQITTGTLQGVRVIAGVPTTTVLATGVADGRAHHVYIGQGASTMYFDGVLVAGTGLFTIPTGSALKVGAGFNGTLGLVSLYLSALSPTRIAAHARSILNGFTADRSDQRVARLLTYAGYTGTPALEVGTQTTVPVQSTAGVNALDAIQAVANSEGGLFFIRGDGVPVLQNRAHRVLEITPDWSIVAIDMDPGTTYVADTQFYINYATAKAVTGVEQVAQDAASVALNGQFPTSLDLLVATDAEALDAASWLVHTRSSQKARLPTVTIDLLSASTAFQRTALAIEISDRLSPSGMPAQAPATGDLIIEGWTETVTATSWQMVLNTSAQDAYIAPICDTAYATADVGVPCYF